MASTRLGPLRLALAFLTVVFGGCPSGGRDLLVLPSYQRQYAASRVPVAVRQGRPRNLERFEASPDGVLAVALGHPAGGPSDVLLAPPIVDLDRNVVVGNVWGHTTPPDAARWFAGGNWLVTTGADTVVTNVVTGAHVRRIEARAFVSDRGPRPPALVVVPPVSEGEKASVIDAETGETWTFDAPANVTKVVAGPVGRFVFADRGDRLVAFRDGREIHSRRMPYASDRAIVFSANGEFVAVGAKSPSAEVLATSDGRLVGTVEGTELQWHPERSELTARLGDRMTAFDAETAETTSETLQSVAAVTVEPATGHLFVLDTEGRVHRRIEPEDPFEVVASFAPRSRSCTLGFESGLLSRAVCLENDELGASTIVLATREERLAMVAEETRFPFIGIPEGDAQSVSLDCSVGPRFVRPNPMVRYHHGRTLYVASRAPGSSLRGYDPARFEAYESVSTGTTDRPVNRLVKLDRDRQMLWSVAVDGVVDRVEIHPSGEWLLVRHAPPEQTRVDVRDASTGRLVRNHVTSFEAAVWMDPVRDRIFATERDDKVAVLDARSGVLLARLKDTSRLHFTEDGEHIVATGSAKRAPTRILHARSLRPVATMAWEMCGGYVMDSGPFLVCHTHWGDDGPEGLALFEVATGIWLRDVMADRVVGATLSGLEVFARQAGTRYSGEVFVVDLKTGTRASLTNYALNDDLKVAEEGRVLAIIGDGRVRLLRRSDRATMFVYGIDTNDSCEPVMIDPDGRFEGENKAAAKVVQYRLGDDLRRSRMVAPGDPEAEPMRVRGALSTFLGLR